MTQVAGIRRIVATHPKELRAELHDPRELRYDTDPGATARIPSHVRAASAIRRMGSRRVVVQDDVNALAIIDDAGRIEPVLMPPGSDGRRSFDDTLGNKDLKMDLEAAVLLPDARMLAFGSGSARTRERIVLFDSSGVRVRRAPGLYARLRRYCTTVGAALNIEGAVVQGGRLRLFQRGHRGRSAGVQSANLVFDFGLAELSRWLAERGPVPHVMDALDVDLGTIDGVSFGFTDAAVTADGRIAFLACAEDTENALNDGPVLGCRFGWLDDQGARVTDVIEPDGTATALKLEGIEPRPGSTAVFDVVADMDRPDRPSLLAELRVSN